MRHRESPQMLKIGVNMPRALRFVVTSASSGGQAKKMDVPRIFAEIKRQLAGNRWRDTFRAGCRSTSLIRGPNRADLARVAASDCPGVHATPSAAAFLLAPNFP